MAKDPDKLAADFAAESSGGLLAEEDTLDRRMLWRLGSWGLGAVGAVVIAVMANQSALTFKRDQVAAVDVGRQAQQLQTLAKESHTETRRLASAIDTLSSDRDRLYSRVSTLEQGLDSVTGAITKQVTAPVVAPTSSAATPGAAPIPVNAPPAPPALPAPVPAVAPVASTAPAAPDRPAGSDKPAAASAAVIASPMTAAAAASADDAKPTAPSPPAALVADKPTVAGSGDVTSAPIPPLVVNADPDSEIDDDAGAPKAQIQRTEFGVDLGTANSLNGLRALWRGLVKSKTNAPLLALRPIIVIKENTNGLGMQLRLVAGPLRDAGTAAKICASLSLPQRACETAIYDGQRLALTADDAPAASKPVPPQRRLVPKRAAAPPVAEEKKPEPTTFSSMFRRNSQ